MESSTENIRKSNLSVLIVEDDEIYAARIVHWIKHECARVELAKSAEHGIFYVTSMDPDIIFLDNNLPKQSGRDVLELYREISPNSHIYMMTSANIEEYKQQVMDHGASQFLDKRGLQKSIVHGILLEVAAAKMRSN